MRDYYQWVSVVHVTSKSIKCEINHIFIIIYLNNYYLCDE
jgi:hypothetical protein